MADIITIEAVTIYILASCNKKTNLLSFPKYFLVTWNSMMDNEKLAYRTIPVCLVNGSWIDWLHAPQLSGLAMNNPCIEW